MSLNEITGGAGQGISLQTNNITIDGNIYNKFFEAQENLILQKTDTGLAKFVPGTANIVMECAVYNFASQVIGTGNHPISYTSAIISAPFATLSSAVDIEILTTGTYLVSYKVLPDSLTYLANTGCAIFALKNGVSIPFSTMQFLTENGTFTYSQTCTFIQDFNAVDKLRLLAVNNVQGLNCALGVAYPTSVNNIFISKLSYP